MYPQLENITPSFDIGYIFMSGSKLPKMEKLWPTVFFFKKSDSDPINSIIFLPQFRPHMGPTLKVI